MNTQEVLATNYTKTRKMQLLFELGKTRTEVATLMGVGYGFVQNVYKKTYPDRVGRARHRQLVYRARQFNRQFGIEIECYGVSRERLAREIRNLGVDCYSEGYNHNSRSHWKVVRDGSINARRGQACEVVSPILQGEDGLQQLEKVCQALYNCRALINKSCGLHIHFNAREFDLNTWKRIFKNYIKHESVIDSMMPRSRRANNNTYCKSMMNRFSSQTEAFGKIDRARRIQSLASTMTGRERYYKINVESYFRHGTIEFRQHSGTREFSKMKNWILFLHRLVDFSEQGFTSDNGNFESMATFMEENNHDFYHNRIEELAA